MKSFYRSLWITLFLLPTLQLYGQQTGTLKIENITLVINNVEQTVPDLTLPFEWDKDSKEYMLFKNDSLAIVGKYRISTHKIPRSSLKNSAVNVIINYYTTFGEKKDKRRSEKIFYLDQDRKFHVDELFTYKKGYTSNIVKLSYDGQLME